MGEHVQKSAIQFFVMMVLVAQKLGILFFVIKMKKLLLFFALLFITTSAYAEWIYFSKNVGGDIFFYDKSNVKRNGDKVKVWTYMNTLPDDKEAKSLNTGSGRSLEEIDCVNETSKRLTLHIFTKIDLEGDMRNVPITNPTITYIVPDSTHATLMKLVCKK